MGIATLYRRFATREDLIEATYGSEIERLADSADRLLRQHLVVEALHRWLASFVDYMQTKQGMSEALPAVLGAQEGLRSASRAALRDAIQRLLHAGADSSLLRTDVGADVVMMAIGGVRLISQHEGQRQLASRLIALLLDGLRTRFP